MKEINLCHRVCVTARAGVRLQMFQYSRKFMVTGQSSGIGWRNR
jgi:hypothetical protein